MPMVGGKKYSYTSKGRAAAAKARKRAATPKNRRTKTIGGRRGR